MATDMHGSAIDAFDTRILRALQRDARISNAKLAEEVSLSKSAVQVRVRRLRQERVILGFETRLDPGKLQAGMLVFVGVVLDRSSPANARRFTDAINASPNIVECHLVTGDFDYLIKVRVANLQAHRQLVEDLLGRLQGVRSACTFAAMEELKCTATLPL